jgi:hypothetical protein
MWIKYRLAAVLKYKEKKMLRKTQSLVFTLTNHETIEYGQRSFRINLVFII